MKKEDASRLAMAPRRSAEPHAGGPAPAQPGSGRKRLFATSAALCFLLFVSGLLLFWHSPVVSPVSPGIQVQETHGDVLEQEPLDPLNGTELPGAADPPHSPTGAPDGPLGGREPATRPRLPYLP